jgi:hypothetical protein
MLVTLRQIVHQVIIAPTLGDALAIAVGLDHRLAHLSRCNPCRPSKARILQTNIALVDLLSRFWAKR